HHGRLRRSARRHAGVDVGRRQAVAARPEPGRVPARTHQARPRQLAHRPRAPRPRDRFGTVVSGESMATKSSYDADAIQTLEGLDAVRKRPGMYIGGTGSAGLLHLVWELIDNAIDEAAAGYANRIEVTFHRDKSIEVSDNG